MEQQYDVLIVGAGHGGAQTAIALNQAKFAGTVALLGEETELPYERPPLSKEYFSGERSFEHLLIRPYTYWTERKIALLLGKRATAVDAGARIVTLADGSTVSYGVLVWAAGGVPRRLNCPGHDLSGVFGLRTRADADRILAKANAARHVLVVGGGYIGLEAASALIKLGKHVTVLETLDRVLARVAGEPLSRFYEAEHRAHGVDIRLSQRLESLVGKAGHVAGARLESGEVIAADMVIVGIGIVPSVEPLLAAGAEGGNGVAVDSMCRTSLHGIYAIGDCALHENIFADGAQIRLESVQNANDQASVVARCITGHPEPYLAAPWFWSNQYDLKLQTFGLSTGFDAIVTRGDPASRSFSLIYLRAGRVVALDCVNSMRDFVQGKALVLGGISPDTIALADPQLPIKSLVAS